MLNLDISYLVVKSDLCSIEIKLLEIINSKNLITMEVGLFDIGLVEVGERWPKLQKEYRYLNTTKRIRQL